MVAHISYFDTSCLIKRYINEPGSDRIGLRFDNTQLICTSNLTFAEFYATIYRLCRSGYLDSVGKNRVLKNFEDDWKIISVVDLNNEILDLIPRLVEKSPVTGADAIHLATAVTLNNKGVSSLFVCSDIKLLNAAKTNKLKIFNPLE